MCIYEKWMANESYSINYQLSTFSLFPFSSFLLHFQAAATAHSFASPLSRSLLPAKHQPSLGTIEQLIGFPFKKLLSVRVAQQTYG